MARRIARPIHLVVAWLLVAGLLVQVFLAGMGVFDSSSMFATHRDFGYTLTLLPVILIVTSLVGGFGRWETIAAAVMSTLAAERAGAEKRTRKPSEKTAERAAEPLRLRSASAAEAPANDNGKLIFGLAGLAAAGWVILISIYLVGFWCLTGQTPGMRFMGIRVTDRRGATPGLVRSLRRLVGMYVSAIPAGAGFLLVLVDDRRQGLHDRIAGTLVIHASRDEVWRGRPRLP